MHVNVLARFWTVFTLKVPQDVVSALLSRNKKCFLHNQTEFHGRSSF